MIFLFEQDASTREVVKSCLGEFFNLPVIATGYLNEGLSLIRFFKFDIFLLNYCVYGDDKLSSFIEIIPPQSKIIILTANSTITDSQFYKMGATQILRKPFDIDELSQAIKL